MEYKKKIFFFDCYCALTIIHPNFTKFNPYGFIYSVGHLTRKSVDTRSGHILIWMRVGQGPAALAVGAGGVVWTFLLLSFLFFFSLCLGDGPM